MADNEQILNINYYYYNKTDIDAILENYATKDHTHDQYLTNTTLNTKVDIAQGTNNALKNVVTNANGNITTEPKPIIPTKVSDLTNDLGFIDNVDWEDIDNKPNTFSPSTHIHVKTDITDFPTIPSTTAQIKDGTAYGNIGSAKNATQANINALINTKLGAKINKTDIVTNLNSDATNVPLSANQGKILNTAINNLNQVYTTLSGTVDGKEDISNKITAWSSSASTTKYPSEKLVKTALNNKVDKVSGKGLSTNDFTDAYLNKLLNVSTNENILYCYNRKNTQLQIGQDYLVAEDELDISTVRDNYINFEEFISLEYGQTLEDFFSNWLSILRNDYNSESDFLNVFPMETFLYFEDNVWEDGKYHVIVITGNNSVAYECDYYGLTDVMPLDNIAFTGLEIENDLITNDDYPATSKAIKDYVDGQIESVVAGDVDLSATHNHDDRYFTQTQTTNALNDKENISNKTSSWHTNPNNTYYPSEKLVKDSLDTKSNVGHEHTGLTHTQLITGSGYDLNDDVTFTGNNTFLFSGNGAAATANSPTTTAGRLEIRHYKNGSYLYDIQIYYEIGGNKNIFYRVGGKAGSSNPYNWSEWTRITTLKDLPTKTSELINDGDGTNVFVKNDDSRLTNTRIPTFTNLDPSTNNRIDLNNKYQNGFYYVNNNDGSKYVLHTPLTMQKDGVNATIEDLPITNEAFFLLIEGWNSENIVKQQLTYYNSGDTYIRVKSGATTGWRPWEKVLTASDTLVPSDNTVSTAKIVNNAVTLDKLNSNVIDSTVGGTDNSNKLITSNAVYNGLKPINDRYEGKVIAIGGNSTQPFYRLLRMQSVSGSSKSSKIIFEINGLTSTSYVRFAIYLRQNTSTQASTLGVEIIDCVNFDVRDLWFGFSKAYPNSLVDVYMKKTAMFYCRTRMYDDQMRKSGTPSIPEGTYTQYIPVQFNATNGTGGYETYSSIQPQEGSTKVAETELNITYDEVIQGNPNLKGTLDDDLTNPNKIVVTNTSDQLKTISQLPFDKVNITKNDIIGLGIAENDTTYTAGTNLSLSGTTFNHNTSGVSATTSTALKNIQYDAQGHITGVGTPTLNSDTTDVNKIIVSNTSNQLKTINQLPFNKVNITKNNITELGIAETDTTYTAGTNLSLNGTTFNHTTSGITATTSAALKNIKYDAQGHITGVETPTLNSDTTDVNKIIVSNTSNQLKTINQLPFNKVNISQNDVANLGISKNDHVHSYNDLNDKPTVDTTDGGTENSTNLITSGAVYDGLKPFVDRYDGVIVRTSGNTFTKPYYRIFRLQTDKGQSKNASLIFEIISLTRDGKYARIKVDIRQNTSTNAVPCIYSVYPLEVNALGSEIHFAFSSEYNNNYLDIFLEITSLRTYVVRVYDGHMKNGSYTQFSPVQDGDENYLTINDYANDENNADYVINGGQTYDNPIQNGVVYNITADKFIKNDGTSSQFLKADGSLDNNTYSLIDHTHDEIIEEIPSPNSDASNSKGLGTQSAGVSNDYARADHVHPRPTLTLRQTLTKNGATVKVYEDGFNVYVAFSGTTTSMGSRAEINVGTISTAAYRPANDQYGIIASAGADIKCYGYISDAGVIIIAHTSDVSATRVLHGYVTYPLKSRLP